MVHGDNVNANGLKSPELKMLAELGKGYHAEQDQLVKLASGLGYKDAFLYDVTHAGKDFILSNFDVIDRSIEVYDSFTEPSYKESFSDLRAGAITAVSIFPFSRVGVSGVAAGAGVGANGAKVLSGANNFLKKASNQHKYKIHNTDKHPSTFVGRKGQSFKVLDGVNKPAIIDGVSYSNHALDKMQQIGVTPSVIKDVINNGKKFTANHGRIGYYSSDNNIKVIMEQNKKVVTITYGK